MFLNERIKPKELNYYEVLSRRCELSRAEERKLSILQKGFEGEREYDSIFDEAGHENLLIYRDVWMKIEGSTLQIDALIITENALIVNEIKNYSGLYSFGEEGWIINGTQISEDPLAQASRTGNKLIKLRYLLHKNFEREYKVVFVNPNFNLRIKPEDERNIVQRSMLRHYMKELNKMHVGPRAYEMSKRIQEFFIENPIKLDRIETASIKLGNYCFDCGAYNLDFSHYFAVCRKCGHRETLEKMFVRGIIDYSILYPDEPMTTSKIERFLMNLLRPRTMRRLLNKYCDKVGNYKSSSYKIKGIELEKLLLENNYTSKYEVGTKLRKTKATDDI